MQLRGGGRSEHPLPSPPPPQQLRPAATAERRRLSGLISAAAHGDTRVHKEEDNNGGLGWDGRLCLGVCVC